MIVQGQSLICPSIWCDGSLPSWEHEYENEHQAIPALKSGQSFSMGGKEEYINEAIEWDNIWKIRMYNRIPIEYVDFQPIVT